MISLHFLCVQFEQENRALYEEMNSMTEDVRSVSHCVWTRRFQFSLSRSQGWELVSMFSLFFLVFADSLWYNHNGWRGVKHRVTYWCSQLHNFSFFFCIGACLYQKIQMVSPVVWIKVEVFIRSSMLPPQPFFQHFCMGPLLPYCFSEEGTELQNVLWGRRSCLALAIFSMCQP